MTTLQNTRPDEPGGTHVMARRILAVVVAMAAIFTLGTAAGMSAAAVQFGADLPTLGVIAVLLPLAALGGWAAVALWRRGGAEPLSPRTRRAQRLFNWSIALGALCGAALGIGTLGDNDPFAMFSDSPLPALPVAVAIAIYLTAIPFLSWRWWRSIDEHEADAYRFGALSAATLYLFITPVWWLGWRGGFLPEPQHMLVLALVTLVWCAGWAWRRHV